MDHRNCEWITKIPRTITVTARSKHLLEDQNLTSGMHFENEAGKCFFNFVLALISDGRFMALPGVSLITKCFCRVQ